MRRISPVAWLLLALVVAAVALESSSTPASLALGAAAALLALGIVLDALGGEPSSTVELLSDRPADRHTSKRYRDAVRRVFPGRDWDRRAPDAPDEPPDLAWERERRRRGLR